MSTNTVNWIPIAEEMPRLFQPVLVAGGCAFWNGDYWFSFMSLNHPRIEWDVQYWASLPKSPGEHSRVA